MKPYTAHHVGRRGEVAGGMTQVVNGYLGWNFAEFETAVLVSRDGSRGLRGAVVAAQAVVRMLALRGRRRVVVVVHLSGGGSFVREGGLLILAHLLRLPTIAHLHGSQFASFARVRPHLVTAVLRRADIVIALSDESVEVTRRLVQSADVRLVPNAVPPGANNAVKEHLVVFGGAVSRRKGVDTLARAWRSMSRRRPDHGWILAIAGPVVDRDVVPEQEDGIELRGALPHAELMSLLESSAIAVLPSRDEAMPMFLLEAMARSNAIISTPVGGIPAVLAGGAGQLVNPEDADGLSSALELLIDDGSERAAAAVRARTAFDASFSAAAIFPQVEAVWKDALLGRRR